MLGTELLPGAVWGEHGPTLVWGRGIQRSEGPFPHHLKKKNGELEQHTAGVAVINWESKLLLPPTTGGGGPLQLLHTRLKKLNAVAAPVIEPMPKT